MIKKPAKPIAKSIVRGAPPVKPAPRLSLWKQLFQIDRMLAASGVAAAIGSASFAGYMLVDADHPPYINGGEYFSLFAQPSSFRRSGQPPSQIEIPMAQVEPANASARQATRNSTQPGNLASATGGLDRTPTGSISAEGSEQASTQSVEDYRLIAVDENHAWFSVGAGFEEVKAGDFLPRLGQIDSMRLVDGKWRLVMKDGTILSPHDESTPVPLQSGVVRGR